MLHVDLGNIVGLLIVWGSLGFVFIFGNLFLFRHIADTQKRENATLTWPTVPGEITTSKVKKRHDSENGNVSYPHVVYTYEVNGKKT